MVALIDSLVKQGFSQQVFSQMIMLPKLYYRSSLTHALWCNILCLRG
jgi:hypothetical protein